ncbi:MAG TPA: YafY family protein [Phototrophicaceae bacterium]|jgi:predicted DNA-binding transcriptional regulator YafY|nr:YafY family protein [Phototrophicaceae bacterium]
MRADRLISLMLLLNARGRMTAQKLAVHLEVSERTIYRDIDALNTAGIPIYVQPGVNGGIFLDESYRISLTGLNRNEVQALFVSGQGRPLADLGLDSAGEATLLKLFAALPSAHQAEVERLRSRFYIDPANWFQVLEKSVLALLPTLQQAVWEDRAVMIRYQVIEGEWFEGAVNAYALVAKANVWYLVAEKEPGEFRNYRMGRIKQAELTDTRFVRQPEFDLATYWEESCRRFEEHSREQHPPYQTVLRVRPNAFWYFPGFMESRYTQQGEPDEEGRVILDVTYDDFGDARTRILGLGAGVEVLEPLKLRDEVIAFAHSIVEAYG